jgi:hypothetical protein
MARNAFLATRDMLLAARNAFLVARTYFFPQEITHGLGTRRFPLILQINAVRTQVFGFCMQGVPPVWDSSQLNPRNLDSSQLNPWNLDSRRLNPWNLDSGRFFFAICGNLMAWNLDPRNLDPGARPGLALALALAAPHPKNATQTKS